ncbi:hypothetical protein C8Q72DRAFT_5508 [Fomitopsis betulina]|nr:hypothetical protein C8Q72DRAFT_645040 [Fomitopsis betulina]KAI0736511.1 hypothetical protein C8Q72DRAFT_5508 [Fomitopsis betulina]
MVSSNDLLHAILSLILLQVLGQHDSNGISTNEGIHQLSAIAWLGARILRAFFNGISKLRKATVLRLDPAVLEASTGVHRKHGVPPHDNDSSRSNEWNGARRHKR